MIKNLSDSELWVLVLGAGPVAGLILAQAFIDGVAAFGRALDRRFDARVERDVQDLRAGRLG